MSDNKESNRYPTYEEVEELGEYIGKTFHRFQEVLLARGVIEPVDCEYIGNKIDRDTWLAEVKKPVDAYSIFMNMLNSTASEDEKQGTDDAED